MLEVLAEKPGNVTRRHDFADAGLLDFLLSAAAIAPVFAHAQRQSVGRTILRAVRATRRVTPTNTNLGMVLLFAPLAKADTPTPAAVEAVLRSLTVADARDAYAAIRLANPGGLGTAQAHDVADAPAVTLREAMAAAADRDGVARQYANGFAEVFAVADDLGTALPTTPLHDAIVGAFARLLARHPDTLIARKCGAAVAAEASRRAADGNPTLDSWLRADGNRRNPGTTADLVAAGLFVACRSRTIRFPLSERDRASFRSQEGLP